MALAPSAETLQGQEAEALPDPGSLPVLFFKTGSAELGPEVEPALQRIAQTCSRMPGIRVSVHGHADREGSAEFNMKLSQKRAKNVGDLLARLAELPAYRVQTRGYGEFAPRASNATPEGRMENRRVEVFLISGQEEPAEPTLDARIP